MLITQKWVIFFVLKHEKRGNPAGVTQIVNKNAIQH